MDYKSVILVFTFLAGCIAFPTPKDDISTFFNHMDVGSRIIGGTEAAEGSHPHMVGLSSGLLIRMFLCGGSLVSRRTILTAAHCITNVYSGGALVRTLRATVGTTRWASGGTDYTLERNVTHPNFLQMTLKNDIGLLITNSDVVLSNLVQIVPIAYDFIPSGVEAKVAGWGRIRAGGAMSSTLRELTTATIDSDDCVALAAQASIDFEIPAPAVEPHIEVCTSQAAGTGNCHGDSGSALTRIDNGQQFGIVSWGFSCALGAPEMYVRVSAYQSWLQTNIV